MLYTCHRLIAIKTSASRKVHHKTLAFVLSDAGGDGCKSKTGAGEERENTHTHTHTHTHTPERKREEQEKERGRDNYFCVLARAA